VFGEENGNPIPLALSRNITKRLSSDPTESTDPSEPAFDAQLSIPITPVTLGDSSTDIRRLLVLMLTGEEGTHSRVQLRIITTNPPSQVVVFDMPPPSLPADSAQGSQDHQEDDQASFYYVEEETGNPVIIFRKSDLDDTSITLSLQEAGDPWLPASFFIFGIEERVATSPVTIVPLVHIPVWDQTGHGTLEDPIPVPLPLSP